MKAWMCGFVLHCLPLLSSPPMCMYASGRDGGHFAEESVEELVGAVARGIEDGVEDAEVALVLNGPGALARSG